MAKEKYGFKTEYNYYVGVLVPITSCGLLTL